MEDLKRRLDFRELIYSDLVKTLGSYSYELTYDNRNATGIDKWIFRLAFRGQKKIEIFNDDWRDYTEYFRIKVNRKKSRYLMWTNIATQGLRMKT